jgi:N-methylhydantoinase B
VLNPDGEGRVLPAKTLVELRRGDVLRHTLAGAGGHGSPLERDPEAVLTDVIDEKVSVEAARRDYGVVIEEDRLDRAETAALRATL